MDTRYFVIGYVEGRYNDRQGRTRESRLEFHENMYRQEAFAVVARMYSTGLPADSINPSDSDFDVTLRRYDAEPDFDVNPEASEAYRMDLKLLDEEAWRLAQAMAKLHAAREKEKQSRLDEERKSADLAAKRRQLERLKAELGEK